MPGRLYGFGISILGEARCQLGGNIWVMGDPEGVGHVGLYIVLYDTRCYDIMLSYMTDIIYFSYC